MNEYEKQDDEKEIEIFNSLFTFTYYLLFIDCQIEIAVNRSRLVESTKIFISLAFLPRSLSSAEDERLQPTER